MIKFCVKKLYLLSILTLTSIALIYSCSSEEEDTPPPPSVVVTPESEPTAPTQYTLIVTAGEGGTVSTEGGTYDEGAEVTITATPDEGFEFVGWEGSNSLSQSLTVTLYSNQSYQALFELIPIYTVTVTESEGGVVSGSGEFTQGTQVTIIATADEQYDFLGWEGSVESDENSITIIVDENIVVKPIFVKSVVGESAPVNICKIDNVHLERGVGFGFPRYNYSLNSTGTIKMTLIFIDFDDSPAQRSIEEVYSILNPISADFFYKSSFGNLNVEFDVINNWFRMSKNSDEYDMYRGSPNAGAYTHYNYLNEALSLADGSYDFSQTDTFIVITNPDAEKVDFGPAFVGNEYSNFKADGKTFYTSTNSGYDLNVWGGLWLNHEVLHNMGLPDLYKYGGDPTWHGLVGQFSIMGLISGDAPDLFAYEKWMLGWIDDVSIFCGNQEELIVDLKPIESFEQGNKMIILPINETKSIAIESRRAIELDENIQNEGVLIYLVDSSKLTGEGTIIVLPENQYDEFKFDYLLQKGDSFTYDNYEIEVLHQNLNYDRVRIIKQ